MSKSSFYCTVTHVDGKHDSKKIKGELGIIPGVTSVSVNNSTGKIAVDFDTTGVQSDRLRTQLEDLGYNVVESTLENHRM